MKKMQNFGKGWDCLGLFGTFHSRQVFLKRSKENRTCYEPIFPQVNSAEEKTGLIGLFPSSIFC